MPKTSAGLLMYRRRGGSVEVFLVHPGGPFWAKKDAGSWSIPKGEFNQSDAPDEDPNEYALKTAKREFEEETGFKSTELTGPLRSAATRRRFHPLTPIKQAGGKIVYAWFLEGDLDASAIKSNTFSMEWPPRSGKQQEFPEVDRAGWFSIDEAKEKILKAQVGFIDELIKTLGTVDSGE